MVEVAGAEVIESPGVIAFGALGPIVVEGFEDVVGSDIEPAALVCANRDTGIAKTKVDAKRSRLSMLRISFKVYDLWA
jgi:hypothetical protein